MTARSPAATGTARFEVRPCEQATLVMVTVFELASPLWTISSVLPSFGRMLPLTAGRA
jgi:hypothetical protein